MELTREEYEDFLADVLEIMYQSGEDEPGADDAVAELREVNNISDSTANSLANAAFFGWPQYSQGT